MTFSSAAVEAIPHCVLCGGKRRFELQLMPQLLHFLDADAGTSSSNKHDKGMDFDTLAVYTCTSCCEPPKEDATAYAEQFVWLQMSS